MLVKRAQRQLKWPWLRQNRKASLSICTVMKWGRKPSTVCLPPSCAHVLMDSVCHYFYWPWLITEASITKTQGQVLVFVSVQIYLTQIKLFCLTELPSEWKLLVQRQYTDYCLKGLYIHAYIWLFKLTAKLPHLACFAVIQLDASRDGQLFWSRLSTSGWTDSKCW